MHPSQGSSCLYSNLLFLAKKKINWGYHSFCNHQNNLLPIHVYCCLTLLLSDLVNYVDIDRICHASCWCKNHFLLFVCRLIDNLICTSGHYSVIVALTHKNNSAADLFVSMATTSWDGKSIKQCSPPPTFEPSLSQLTKSIALLSQNNMKNKREKERLLAI